LIKPWTVKRLLEWTVPYFKDLGLDKARLNSEMLLASSLGVDRLWLYTHYDQPLTGPELDSFRSAVIRRSKREPLQYILGHWGFWSLDFIVRPGVLIPRQETEHLVECVLKFASSAKKILDICTGSGNIVISLAKELPSSSLWATDISSMAIKTAMENAWTHRIQDRICFLCGDLFAPVKGHEGSFDLIICNPPYVPTNQISKLQAEIKDFEPRVAVDGGEDGLSFYRRLIPGAITFLKPSGYLIMEIGENQTKPVQDMMCNWGYKEVTVFKDYGGLDRVIAGKSFCLEAVPQGPGK
jgi:release factor glutamine methyltransferase